MGTRDIPDFQAEAFKAQLLLAMDELFSPDDPLAPQAEQREALADFLTMVADKNRYLNLTAVTEAKEMVRLHLIDSLSLLPYLDRELERCHAQGRRCCVLDLGTGAGFPGIPLKIMRPEIEICLADALEKRILFLQTLEEKAGPESGVELLHGRGEEMGRLPQYRERFDFVIARAVAELRILAELTLPLTKEGGLFCAMKASKGKRELEDAERALSLLGGTLEAMPEFELPGGETRMLLLIRKNKATAKIYPRPFSRIRKQPL